MRERTTCGRRASLLGAALSAASLLVLITMVLTVLAASGALRGLGRCPTCKASAGERASGGLGKEDLWCGEVEVGRERVKCSRCRIKFHSYECRLSSSKGYTTQSSALCSCAHVHVCTIATVYKCICARVHVCVCACVCVCMHACVCVYVYVHVCMSWSVL